MPWQPNQPVGPIRYTVVCHHNGYAVEQRMEPAQVMNYLTIGQAERHAALLNAEAARLTPDADWEELEPLDEEAADSEFLEDDPLEDDEEYEDEDDEEVD